MSSFIVLKAFRRKNQGISSTMLSLYSSSTIKASFHSSFPPLRSSPPPLSVGSHIRLVKRDHSVAAASGGVSMSTNRDSHGSSSQVAEPFFRSVLGQMETVYLNRNPTPRSVLELVRSVDDEQLCYDHLAFRTFGIGGYGIDSLASFFLDYGYTQMDELRWSFTESFISELLVEQMSTQTQDVIRRYTETSPNGRKYAALSSALGSLPWEKPLSSEFEQLARESEYAAWTLANGYALNHHFRKTLTFISAATSDLNPKMATEATTASKFQDPDLRPVSQFKPETAHDGLRFWQFMIAGSIAGSVEHMAMFPVDTIKTHMQALRPCPLKPVGIRQAFRSIIQKEGPSALYRGIWAMGLGAGPAHAVYFSFYERLQMGEGTYRGVWDCVRRVMREEGFGAFYASYRTTVLMNAPFTAVHFATYEAAKKALVEVSPERVGDEEGWLVHATAGAAAGGLAAAVTTPLDVVKTQLQCQGVCGCDRFTSSSISDVLKTIVKKDGYRGLLRGWLPRMLFHAPAAAICWSTYEGVKSFFQDFNGDPNTA
ncbi:hypothetical protein Bca52824_062137 [Brassica carinata]|uniref:2-oxoadipate dioxygenase/decarboxylase n=1 Tax=Brassica carinata TaxID=52824 RepID=A0A8X7QE28_BRACI|nr:hypothetical protein Bca52824_062137 [Brassica carinata]